MRKEFDTRAVLKNDRTMVPLRFISETLGAGVAWDEVNNTAIIRTDGVVEAVSTPVPNTKTTPDSTTKPFPTAPIPTGTPSPTNPIPGNPCYVNGLTSKEDLSRFLRLQGLIRL